MILLFTLIASKALGQTFVQFTDSKTGEVNNFRKIDTYLDGTKVDDSKVDDVYLIKKNGQYYMNGTFYQDRVVYINKYSELLGKDREVSIKQAFPNVKLSDVKKYDNTATLNNSATWYIMSKLLDILPTGSTIVLDGKYYLDLPLKIKRSRITIKGMDNATEKRSFFSKTLLIASGQNDLIQIVNGDGKTHHLTGYIEYVTISNLHLMGNWKADEISRYGILFDFDSKGTMMNCKFDQLNITNFRVGIKHKGGHINSLKFTDVSCNGNFEKGFDFIGDGQNQCNAIIFEGGGASSNGYKTSKGQIVPLTKSDNYQNSGGFFIKGGTALNFIGTDYTANYGYGMNFGSSHAYGCSFKFYSEANFVDFKYQNTINASRSLDFSFYSRDQSVQFTDKAVQAKYFKD